VLLQDIRCAVSRGAAAIGAELRLLSELQCAKIKMLSLPPPSRVSTALARPPSGAHAVVPIAWDPLRRRRAVVARSAAGSSRRRRPRPHGGWHR